MPKTKPKSVLEQAPREKMPRRLDPMLAKPGQVPESEGQKWAYEIKWDGVRALGYAEKGEWCMLTRRQEDYVGPLGRRPAGTGLLVAEIDRKLTADDGLDRHWIAPATGVDRHRGYAFQWFSLSVLLGVIALGLSWRVLRGWSAAGRAA